MQEQQNNYPHQYKLDSKPPKYDNAVIGLITSLACIIIAIVAVKYLRHDIYTFSEFLSFFTAFENPFILSEAAKILSLAMIVLLAPFYFFLNKRAYLATRGVIIMAMIMAVLIMFYKFIW